MHWDILVNSDLLVLRRGGRRVPETGFRVKDNHPRACRPKMRETRLTEQAEGWCLPWDWPPERGPALAERCVPGVPACH